MARGTSGRVVLRIEDHDRQRCRPEYETALLEDLAALELGPDEPAPAELRAGTASSYRQSDNGPAYAAALRQLADLGVVYFCDCSRSSFATWAADHGRPWSGPGCPGGCRVRGVTRDASGATWRVALGEGSEAWTDLVHGLQAGNPSSAGDLPVRDRHGNWTYGLCVVVDDLRHGIGLVIRGEDLLDSTPAQIRLGRMLGRAEPPRFLHHPLIRRPDGRKLSKADGATAIRELRERGLDASTVRARAAGAIGLDPDGDLRLMPA